MNDLRYSFRSLFNTPAFTIAAVLTLALGIGANTAIFQLIDAVALRNLPVRNPDELAAVRIVGGNQGFGVNPGRYPELTRPVWEALEADQQAFSGMFAWRTVNLRIGDPSDLRRVDGIAVSGDFFRVLGIEPFRGRMLGPSDEAAACPQRVGVVSHAFWERELGARELGTNTRLTVNQEPVDVVGVTPPDFFGVAVGEQFEIALPLCRLPEPRRELFDIAVMGRLRPGWRFDRASAHVNALSGGIFEANAPTEYSAASIARFKSFRLAAYPAGSGVSALRNQYDTSLRILLVITALILLMACANLANLMLARGGARHREVGIRVAMGASRAVLVRQFLVESGLLAGTGAALAVLLARVFSDVVLRAISTQGGAPDLVVPIDWRVLVFATVMGFGTCIFFGLAPAVRASRIQAATAMRTGGRGTTAGHERLSLQRVMVSTQIAISLVLLVAALLFVRSFRHLMTVDPGMRQEGIMTATLDYPRSLISPDRHIDYKREVLADVKTVPGIVNAGLTTHVPLIGGSWSHGITVGAVDAGAQFTWVSPGYLETMGIPILRGRDFTLRDSASSPRVAIVNQAFVRRFIGTANPLGQTLRTGEEPDYPSTVYEIVGVIPDTQYNDVRGNVRAIVYAPDSQFPSPGPGAQMVIHASVPSGTAIAGIRERLRQNHPALLVEFGVLQSRVRDSLVRERLLAMLAGFFGVLAIVLTIVGLYGMLSYAVAQRRPEIGVRIALGARSSTVVAMIMREAGSLLVVGSVVGVGLSWLAGRSAASLLFGVAPGDPLTLIAACVLLGVIAAVASFLPARRAARLDPVQVLREA